MNIKLFKFNDSESKMRWLRPVLYLLITPFNPKWSFQQFENEKDKKMISLLAFVFGVSIIIPFYYIANFQTIQVDLFYKIFNVFFFIVGFIIKCLIVGYLIILLINRKVHCNLKWIETLPIISFALLTLSVGYIWQIFDYKTANIGYFFGFFWYALVILIGLKILKDIALRQSAPLIIVVLIAEKLLVSIFYGISL